MRRTILLAGLALLVGLALAAPAGARKSESGLKIKNPSVSPNRVPGSGAVIKIGAEVTSASDPISRVAAVVEVPGTGRAPLAVLSAKQKNQFKGSARVPANYDAGSVRGTVYLVVTTAGGQIVEKAIGQIKVGPWNNSGPPPPPTY
jgi:hypothetical protein